MELEGRIIQFLGEQSGTSKSGNPWKKKEWVLETFGNYPRKVKVQAFGDRADNINLEPGRDYILSIDIESREFNGRWYTDVSVFRVQDYTQQVNQMPPQGSNFSGYQQPQQQAFGPQMPYGPQNNSYQTGPETSFASSASESDEDLPF